MDGSLSGFSCRRCGACCRIKDGIVRVSDAEIASVAAEKVSKKKRIEATVLNSFTPLSKSDICSILPDVSPTTVEAVLGAMVRGGLIRRLGGGRGTKYIKA